MAAGAGQLVQAVVAIADRILAGQLGIVVTRVTQVQDARGAVHVADPNQLVGRVVGPGRHHAVGVRDACQVGVRVVAECRLMGEPVLD